MVKLTNQEILGNRGFHAAETVILNQEETFRHTHRKINRTTIAYFM